MPLYGLVCTECGLKMEVLTTFDGPKQKHCPALDCAGPMTRVGIELQKRPHIQGGSSNAKYRN